MRPAEPEIVIVEAPIAPADNSIEYTALINIRPAHGNRAMEVEDAAVRERMRALIRELIGGGEALP